MVQRVKEASVTAFAFGSIALAAVALARRPLMVSATVAAMALVDWLGADTAAGMAERFARVVASGFLQAAITTPLLVAVSRFVVLDGREGAQTGVLVTLYRRYFGWTLLFQVLGAPMFLVSSVMPTADAAGLAVMTPGTGRGSGWPLRAWCWSWSWRCDCRCCCRPLRWGRGRPGFGPPGRTGGGMSGRCC